MKSRILIGATASILALSFSATAYAADDQQAAGATTDGLEDIVVTARRVEERLQDVPVAVTALSAQTLQRRNITAVNDLQFSVPNLQIKPSNNFPSLPEFILRGQRQALFTDENVVTYINGIAQSPRGLTLYDLESVQALKGPQGTLFGKNSMGGAMVFTTKKPVFKTEASVAVEIGNYNRKLVNAMVNVPFGEKVALRAVGQIERQNGFFKAITPGQRDLNNRHNESGRVSLLLAPSNSFENVTVVDYIRRNEVPTPSLIEAAPLANNFFRGVTQDAVRLQSLAGGAAPRVDTANGLLVRQGNPFVSYGFTHFSDTIPTGCVSGTCNVLSHYAAESETYGVANTSTLTVDDHITLKNIIGARYTRATDHQDPSGISGMVLDLSSLLGPGASGYATNNDTYFQNRFKNFSEEFQIIGNLDNFKFITGAYYAHQSHLYAVNSTFAVGPVSFYGPYPVRHSQDNDKTDSFALFGQGTYDFSSMGLNGVHLTAGLRYTIDKKSHSTENFFTTTSEQLQFWTPSRPASTCNELNAPNGSPEAPSAVALNNGTNCSLSDRRTFKALTWTASLEYQPSQDTLMYLATRRGYKAGGPNPTTRSLQYNIFGPERITDLELGFKNEGRIGGMSYRFNVAGFMGWYKQIQTQDILQFCANPAANPADPAACGTYTDLIVLNVGQATIKGVEVEGTLKPIPQLQLDFGYSYQVGRYGSGSVVVQPTNPALPIANSNPLSAGGTDLSGKEFAGVPRHNLSVAATVFADFIPEDFARTSFNVNYYYRSKTLGIPVQGIYQTPGFGTLNARLSFDNIAKSAFSVAFWMSNIADKQYKLFCSNNLNSIGYAACKWGDPRTYGLTASVKF